LFGHCRRWNDYNFMVWWNLGNSHSYSYLFNIQKIATILGQSSETLNNFWKTFHFSLQIQKQYFLINFNPLQDTQ